MLHTTTYVHRTAPLRTGFGVLSAQLTVHGFHPSIMKVEDVFEPRGRMMNSHMPANTGRP